MNIQENDHLEEISSPDDNQSQIKSSTYDHSNVEDVDTLQEHKGATIQHDVDSSANRCLEDGHSVILSPEKMVMASEEKEIEEISTDLSERNALVLSEMHNFTGCNIVDLHAQTNAVEESVSVTSPTDVIEPHLKPIPSSFRSGIVGKHTKHLSLDNFSGVNVHEDVFSPQVGDYGVLNNAAHPALKISRSRFSTQASVCNPKTSVGIFGFNKSQIDTAAPIESVKQAVSKFGGIVDWKAHRVQSVEKKHVIEQELEKLQSEIPSYKKKCEAAEDATTKILNELDNTKRIVEELKLNHEKVQTEERQAKQDAELATLRVEEMEQGIAGEASIAAKAQLEVAKARHATAVSELKAVKDELEALRKDYELLITEKYASERKAEEEVAAANEAEKTVEDLTNELITAKESLGSAHAAHLEAEEHRNGQAMARDQDALNWEKEVKQVEEDLEQLNQKILSAKDLKLGLDAALSLLKSLKDEFVTYMESQLKDDIDQDNKFGSLLVEPEKTTHSGIQSAVASARKELEQVKLNLEKATSEVDSLNVAATSLKAELEKQKTNLATIRKKEETASVTVSSLGMELDKLKSEISLVQMKVKEARDKLVDLPKQLHKASQEAEEAKSIAEIAREELRKAKEEAEQAKVGASSMDSKLAAAKKEIVAAKASEKLALAAIHALQESESARSSTNEDDSQTGVTLTLEEYYTLSKQAHDAEEEADIRVGTAMSQIDIAKESELRNLNKLEAVSREMAERKTQLEVALEKAEKANDRKMGMEHELRKWRAKHEQKRKVVPSEDSVKDTRTSFEDKNLDPSTPDNGDVQYHGLSPMPHSQNNTENESSPELKATKKKKKPFFPRFFMFLARKKSHSKS